jgi:Na+-translocating ferredoxin:NAD+ oxidoreductase RnfG subunit
MKLNEVVRFSLTLGVIAVLAAAGISKVYVKTMGAIAAQDQKTLGDALGFVLPSASAFKAVRAPAPVDSYWVGTNKQGEMIGIAYECRGRGYSGDVVSMVSLDTAGKIIRLRILSQSETQGLGSRAEESATGGTPVGAEALRDVDRHAPWFQRQFEGLCALKEIGVARGAEWQRMTAEKRIEFETNNEVSALAGATVTSTAVAKSIFSGARLVLDIYKSTRPAATDTVKGDLRASAAQ